MPSLTERPDSTAPLPAALLEATAALQVRNDDHAEVERGWAGLT